MGIEQSLALMRRTLDKMQSPDLTGRLAQSLYNRLQASYSWQDDTGNMRRGLLESAGVVKSQQGFSAGIGNLGLLGSPAEQAPPNTIRDFLDWLHGEVRPVRREIVVERAKARQVERERARLKREIKKAKGQKLVAARRRLEQTRRQRQNIRRRLARRERKLRKATG